MRIVLGMLINLLKRLIKGGLGLFKYLSIMCNLQEPAKQYTRTAPYLTLFINYKPL